jgi:bifunctional non-homologous end joining protein LigD
MSVSIIKKSGLLDQFSPSTSEINTKRIFVVHRHLGSILHYDLRFSVNGVLKSWAIPKGPSMNPGDRRLAILVEDQPMSYARFKGVIPEGSYGAGVMEIWDRGNCILHSVYSSGCSDNDFECQLEEGRIRFTLKGKKLKGVFSLVRMNGTDSRQWLLIKGNDKFAVNYLYDCEELTSAKSAITKIIRAREEEEKRIAF